MDPAPEETSRSDTSISDSVAVALEVTLLDEYRAEATYARVLADFGDIRPFSNIIQAEQTHAAAVEGLYTTYGLDRPDNPYSAGSVEGYASVADACAAGVAGEVNNAALYDRFLRLDLPEDVRRVLTSNRDASLNRHLPAFERCAPS